MISALSTPLNPPSPSCVGVLASVALLQARHICSRALLSSAAVEGQLVLASQGEMFAYLSHVHTYIRTCDVVEAHCYVVDVGRTDREQAHSRIDNN